MGAPLISPTPCNTRYLCVLVILAIVFVYMYVNHAFRDIQQAHWACVYQHMIRRCDCEVKVMFCCDSVIQHAYLSLMAKPRPWYDQTVLISHPPKITAACVLNSV